MRPLRLVVFFLFRLVSGLQVAQESATVTPVSELQD